MGYIIRRNKKIRQLREDNTLSLTEKVKRLEEFDNIILCPYRGHQIDLREVREKDCNYRAEEYRCPKCNEWVRWNLHLPWFQQAPYPRNSSRIFNKENYKCVVNPHFEDPSHEQTSEELRTWYDRKLNPIRPKTISINPGEEAVSLSETTYVAVKR